jgi:hypothetical protein
MVDGEKLEIFGFKATKRAKLLERIGDKRSVVLSNIRERQHEYYLARWETA